MAGEDEVATAFQTVTSSAALSDASRDYKNAVAEMRIAVKDFSATPRNDFVNAFQMADFRARKALGAIGGSADSDRANDVNILLTQLSDIKKNFELMVDEQRIVGFTDSDGLRRKLVDAGSGIERIINGNVMTWLADAEAKKLMMLLLTMRHYEADHRLTPRELTRQLFFDTYKKFRDQFDLIDGTPEMKDGLEQQVQLYADTFEKWIDVYNRTYPLQALIDIDIQNMLPRADLVIVAASSAAAHAKTSLAASQGRTRNGIIAVGVAMVAIGLGLSWLIGRSITGPLNGLAAAMKSLAAGDTGVRIPATHAHDEIGEMARTVIVFRDTMIERENLAGTQIEASRTQMQRSEVVGSRHRRVQALGRNRACPACAARP